MGRCTLFATLLAAAASAACAWSPPPPAELQIGGALAQIEVIDRDSGERLPVYRHQGRRYVAGTPGRRYAIAVTNRSGGRVLAVLAVDGINAVSGETAAWSQVGYVLDAGQRHEVRGWRKSHERIAAFEFTALSESYAARSGRPADVGVIGVALFREQQDALPAVSAVPRGETAADKAARTGSAAGASGEVGAPPSAPGRDEEPARAPASAAASDPAGTWPQRASERSERAGHAWRAQPSERLGTGHGRSETSRVTTTAFERAAATPEQAVTIFYDSRANLIAQGVIAEAPLPRPLPRPFPATAGVEPGFVPDPPRR